MNSSIYNNPTPAGFQPTVAQGAFDAEGTGPFSFIVIGDSQPWTMAMDVISQTNQFKALIDMINASGADFAVNVGDLIRGYSGAIPRFNAPQKERMAILSTAYKEDNTGCIEKMWDAYDNICKKINIPYVSLAGNHDVWNKQSQSVWHHRYGPLYFSWKHKGCCFIALCSELREEPGKIEGQQREWLENRLANTADAKAVYVFIHKPYWARANGKNDLAVHTGNWDPDHWRRHIHPLLARHCVTAVFAGHIHNYYQFPSRDGVQYIVTGGGGPEAEILHNSAGEYFGGTPKIGYEIAGKFSHFLQVKTGDNRPEMKVVTSEKEFRPDCVRIEWEPALSSAIEVVPIEHLNQNGDIEIPIHINNPLPESVEASANWHVGNTTWTAETTTITVPAKGRSTLMARAQYEDLYPLPKASIELRSDRTSLVPCRFLEKAFAGLVKFVPAWNIIGPFGLQDHEGRKIDKPDHRQFISLLPGDWSDLLPPETAIDSRSKMVDKHNRETSWKVVYDHGRGGIDLGSLYDEDYAMAFAVAYIYSPKKVRRLVSLGSSDSIFLNINSREIWHNQTIRTATPARDQFMAELKEGWNKLQVSVMNFTGVWGFYFQIIDNDDSLRFGVTPAPGWQGTQDPVIPISKP